ncbi:oxidoreductase [Pseudonocardia sp. CA-142604]|uniref:oxidoreductase n=1 Tax=Pseudonocardia sp. CA-142604 TaxID=3240024 RepID=UPI003D8F564D
MSTTADPLAPLLDLPGVQDAVARARDALVAVHNHPVNRRGWPAGAAEASMRAARASAALDGAPLGGVDLHGGAPGAEHSMSPVLAGAVRVAEESGRLLAVWRTSPLQALARLHVVAAADLVPAERHDAELGRPIRTEGISARLGLLADMLTGGTSVPGPVLAAVVHGELLTLAPFTTANGVVARAAARLTAVAAGLDPKGLAVPEVGHLRHAHEYRTAAAAFAGGTPEGLRTWLLHCCAQWEAGAREGMSIADARA